MSWAEALMKLAFNSPDLKVGVIEKINRGL